MSAQIIQFPGAFKSPSERKVSQLVERIRRVMMDPSLAESEQELKFAQALQACIDRAPNKP